MKFLLRLGTHDQAGPPDKSNKPTTLTYRSRPMDRRTGNSNMDIPWVFPKEHPLAGKPMDLVENDLPLDLMFNAPGDLGSKFDRVPDNYIPFQSFAKDDVVEISKEELATLRAAAEQNKFIIARLDALESKKSQPVSESAEQSREQKEKSQGGGGNKR